MLLLRKKGHMSPEYPDKHSIKNEDWAIRKAKQHMQASKVDDHEEGKADDDNKSVTNNSQSKAAWSGLLIEKESLHSNTISKDRLKNCITLDNGSTLSLFSNPELVEDIQTSR